MKKFYYWVEPTGGSLNQRVKASQISQNEAKELWNITHDLIGVWSSSKGREILGASLSASGQIDGLFPYIRPDYTQDLLAVAATSIYKYDNIDSFDLVTGGTGVFTTQVNISSVSFLNRLYLFSEYVADNSVYYDGTQIQNYGSGDNQVSGRYATVAQDTLWVNLSQYPDRVYASITDESTGDPTDQLYGSDETLATSTRYFILDGPITGMFTLNNEAYAFTENSLWKFDIRYLGTFNGPTRLLDIGCVSHKSIAVDSKFNKVYFFSGRNGFYSWQGSGTPLNISERLIENVGGNGVINQINPNQYKNVSGIAYDGKYFVSVKTLMDSTLDYSTRTTAVYDDAANKWTLRDIDANYFAIWKNSQKETNLYIGAYSDQSVYKIEVGDTNDDETGDAQDITAYIKTKDFTNEFGNPGFKKRFKQLTVIYSGTSDDIEVSYSIDGSDTYTAITTLPQVSQTSSRTEAIVDIPIPNEGYCISFKFEKSSGSMQIIALGIEGITYPTAGMQPS